MDPATLYMLIKLAEEGAKGWKRQFDTMEACESRLAELKKTKPANAEILRSECLPDRTTYNEAPRWYTDALKEKVIRGVPLDPEHMR